MFEAARCARVSVREALTLLTLKHFAEWRPLLAHYCNSLGNIPFGMRLARLMNAGDGDWSRCRLENIASSKAD